MKKSASEIYDSSLDLFLAPDFDFTLDSAFINASAATSAIESIERSALMAEAYVAFNCD